MSHLAQALHVGQVKVCILKYGFPSGSHVVGSVHTLTNEVKQVRISGTSKSRRKDLISPREGHKASCSDLSALSALGSCDQLWGGSIRSHKPRASRAKLPAASARTRSTAQLLEEGLKEPLSQLTNGAVAVPTAVATSADILREITAQGATLDGRGGCVFRVWAPHAELAHVVLYDGTTPGNWMPMQRDGNIWAVHLENIAAGDRYHFAFKHGGHDHERRDARARFTDYDTNACIVVDPAFEWAPFEAPSWDRLNLYQVHVSAFTGREENGGNFAALEEKLEYIKDLGFTAIQLMPVHEYCGSWGYNPRLLFAVHQAYGTPAQLRHLVNAAHRKGLAVIFDVVLNHGAARMNSLWAYDGKNHNSKGGLYFDGGGDSPFGKGFAWWQQEVHDMVCDAALMFLDEYNGDGLRVDCVHIMPWDVLQKLTWRCKERFPHKIIISEITPETPNVVHHAGFDATWIHSSFYDMRAFMHGRRSLRKLESLLALHPGYTSPVQAVKYFLGCHDQIGCRKNGGYDPEIQGVHRYAVDLHGGRDSWDARAICRMWYGAQVAAQGLPMLFMGSEWHHPGWWGVDHNRLLNWHFSQDVTGNEMRALVTDANNLRAGSSALRHGSFEACHHDSRNTILAFRRTSDDQGCLVVINASGNQWTDGSYGVGVGPWGGCQFVEKFNSQAPLYGGWEGSGNSHKLSPHNGVLHINLPKWAVLIFERV